MTTKQTKAKLSHVDAKGCVAMVDVTAKATTDRVAVARCDISMSAEARTAIRTGAVKKGDPLQAARLAGIMGAKRTPDLIPLCHPLALESVKLELRLDRKNAAVEIEATCKTTGRTGVEMEALTAAAIAALTVYDMCKAADREMRITDLRLVRKSGGRSGLYEAKT